MPEKKIRVLVVDDSELIRKKISGILNSDPQCEVIATARDGEEAVQLAFALRPDVITLDILLPKMDGITALRYIMSEQPIPTVMVTGRSDHDQQIMLECLECGAVDFLCKPSGQTILDVEMVQEELLAKVKAAARANVKVLRPFVAGLGEKFPPRRGALGVTQKIIAIASSTGGPRALAELLPLLKPDLGAGLLVVQHMPVGFTKSFSQRLDSESRIRVREAQDGEPVREGEALIAPGDFHMTLAAHGVSGASIRLQRGPKEHGVCPAADVTMRSVADLCSKNCLGVVLTGMGSDGTEGLRAIKHKGGATIAQDQATCVVYGMPRSAMEAGVVDKVLPLSEIPQEIMKWAKK